MKTKHFFVVIFLLALAVISVIPLAALGEDTESDSQPIEFFFADLRSPVPYVDNALADVVFEALDSSREALIDQENLPEDTSYVATFAFPARGIIWQWWAQNREACFLVSWTEDREPDVWVSDCGILFETYSTVIEARTNRYRVSNNV